MYLTPEEEAKQRKEEATKYAPLTGNFARRIYRLNTVHFRGTCPKCGRTNLKFAKDVQIGKNVFHNVWVCPKCVKTFSKNELKEGKYC